MARFVLVADGAPAALGFVRAALCGAGYHVIEASDLDEAEGRLSTYRPVIAVVGEHLRSGASGLDLVKHLRARRHDLWIIFLAEGDTEDLAVRALRAGVNDYLKKPVIGGDLADALRRAFRRPSGRTPASIETAATVTSESKLIGRSPQLRELREYIRKVAQAECNVLILGETGTGKELVAELIHETSPRRQSPFMCINCAAIPDTLLESELFGFERGAFTGAYASREGKLRQAQRGTVFLDEVGDMSPSTQAKLLRVIESREVQSLGGRSPARLDVRFIAASNQDLEAMVQEKDFRQDLFYRLSVTSIRTPPLRERKEDIPGLLHHFIAEFGRRCRAQVTGVTARCLAALVSYPWPGNVRELRNLAEAIFVEVTAGAIDLDHLPEGFLRRLEAAATAPASERDRILSALLSTNWNKSSAAQQLHWSRMTLYRKMAKHRLAKGPKSGDSATTNTP
jgi:two-component system response regulator HydG/two-component system response regulator AtoC